MKYIKLTSTDKQVFYIRHNKRDHTYDLVKGYMESSYRTTFTDSEVIMVAAQVAQKYPTMVIKIVSAK